MAVKFNTHAIGNALDPDAAKKFYLRPVSSGEKTLDELASQISHASSLTEADIYAVLQSLIREIPRALSDGYIVRLGDLGSFRVSVNSEGSDTKERVSGANVRKRRLIFTPAQRMKKELEKIKFERKK